MCARRTPCTRAADPDASGSGTRLSVVQALLIAALSAKGRSLIHNVNQIDRGYQHIDDRLNAIRDATVKDLFSELRDEELVHQKLIQDQMEKLPPDPSLTTEDFEDEPAPQ